MTKGGGTETSKKAAFSIGFDTPLIDARLAGIEARLFGMEQALMGLASDMDAALRLLGRITKQEATELAEMDDLQQADSDMKQALSDALGRVDGKLADLQNQVQQTRIDKAAVAGVVSDLRAEIATAQSIAAPAQPAPVPSPATGDAGGAGSTGGTDTSGGAATPPAPADGTTPAPAPADGTAPSVAGIAAAQDAAQP